MRIKSNSVVPTNNRGRIGFGAAALATAIAEEFRHGDSEERVVASNGEFNASSVREVTSIISELVAHVKRGMVDETAASAEVGGMSKEEAKRKRHELLLAAYNAPGLEKMEEIGASIAATISQRSRREGFMRRVLMRVDIQQGQIPRIRARQNNVEAVSTVGETTVGIQILREKYAFPDEQPIVVNLRIGEKDIQQSSPDLLEDKFFEGLEAIMVREDRIFHSMATRAASMSNDIQYYTGPLTPGVIEALRKQITGWGIPLAGFMLPEDVQTQFLTGSGFGEFFEPVTKLRMFTEGVLGSFWGHDIYTDQFRDPLLKVLKSGEIMALGAPEFLGGYTDRGPVKSEARVNTEDFPGRGWFQSELVSQAIVNPRAVALARKI